MADGFATMLAMLDDDLAFERGAAKAYRQFAEEAADPEAKALFLEMAAAEQGHVNGLSALKRQVEEGTYEVRFFCPRCGWEVGFGPSPQAGAEQVCRMCGVRFRLGLADGDFVMEKVKAPAR